MGGDMCPNVNTIEGQVVVVTGGSGGIGRIVCQDLCNRRAHVVIASKDMANMSKVKDMILKNNPRASVETRYLDLRSFDCIKRFVHDLERDQERVDVLINNAGINFQLHDKTVDGYETHLQINYLGHFYLTTLMLPKLLRKGSRVVNVACHAYLSATFAIEDPLSRSVLASAYHARDAFSHSKAAVIMSTRVLGGLLKEKGVTVNACTPGLVRGTGHLSKSPIMGALCAKVVTYPWMWLFMKTPTQGAQCLIHLATDHKFKTETGGFYNDCQLVEVSDVAQDSVMCLKLFRETMKVLQLSEKSWAEKNQ